MFANRLHNIYQRNFTCTAGELKDLIKTCLENINTCQSKVQAISEGFELTPNPNKYETLLKSHAEKFCGKCQTFQKIYEILEANLEHFKNNSPLRIYEDSSSQGDPHPKAHTESKFTHLERESRQQELLNEGIKVDDIRLDNEEIEEKQAEETESEGAISDS